MHRLETNSWLCLLRGITVTSLTSKRQMKLLIDARGKFRENFLNKMIELSSGAIELGCHIGYETADFHGPSLQWLNNKVGKSGSIIRQQKL